MFTIHWEKEAETCQVTRLPPLRSLLAGTLIDGSHRVFGHIHLSMTTLQALEAGMDRVEHLDNRYFVCARDSEGLLAKESR